MKRKPTGRWKEACRVCKRSHLYEIGKCPSCGVYEISRKVSENACGSGEESCDGCGAYGDHLR